MSCSLPHSTMFITFVCLFFSSYTLRCFHRLFWLKIKSSAVEVHNGICYVTFWLKWNKTKTKVETDMTRSTWVALRVNNASLWSPVIIQIRNYNNYSSIKQSSIPQPSWFPCYCRTQRQNKVLASGLLQGKQDSATMQHSAAVSFLQSGHC